MATAEVTTPAAREAAERLRDSIREASEALERAIEHACRFVDLLEEWYPPRFGSSVHMEARGIRDDLDGSGGSTLELPRLLRDAEDLLDLIDLADSRAGTADAAEREEV